MVITLQMIWLIYILLLFNSTTDNITLISGYSFELVPAREGFLPEWDTASLFDIDIENGNGKYI